jgi:ferritin-like metal-binding protein YciE
VEKNIHDLFKEELQDTLSSEEQIVKALPDMVAAAHCPELKKAFETHLKETRGQLVRLDKIFRLLRTPKKAKFCKATKGLIDECKDVIQEFKKSSLRDVALISKAQRIEHYEISAYGTLRTLAKELNYDAIAALLEATLDEEANADKKLTKLAKGGIFSSGINQMAHTLESCSTKIQSKNSRSIFSKLKATISSVKKTAPRPRSTSKTKAVTIKAKAKSVTLKRKPVASKARKTPARATATRATAKR